MRVVMLAAMLMVPCSLGAQTIARVHPLGGGVRVSAAGAASFVTIRQDVRIVGATLVRTDASGRADIFYDDGERVTLQPGTTVRIAESRNVRASLSLGQIRVRLQRLMATDDAREFRTPVAVAAIRGTDFLLIADERSRTRIYVAEGALSVANSQRLQDSVRVSAGQMTEVLPFLPPAPPRAFGRKEYERGALLGALEAGEDPALEASQQVAHASYLAFRDAIIDAPANPAYLAEAERPRATVFALGSRRAREDGWALDSIHAGAGVGGSAVAARAIGLLPLPSSYSVGAAVGYASDAAEQRPRQGDVLERNVFTTWNGHAFASRLVGSSALGMGAETYESRLHAWSADRGHTRSTNTMRTARAGLLSGARQGRSLGGKAEWSALDANVQAAAARQNMHGTNAMLEGLLRTEGDNWRNAALLRVERTATRERFAYAAGPDVIERRRVWSVRGGPGFGRMVGDRVVFSADLLAGWSYETAQRHDLSGNLLEDELDSRWSATVHAGSQLYLAESWLATIDVLHGGERQLKDFTFPLENVAGRNVRSVVAAYNTRAILGAAYTRTNVLLQYLLIADAGAPTLLQHSVAALWHVGGGR